MRNPRFLPRLILIFATAIVLVLAGGSGLSSVVLSGLGSEGGEPSAAAPRPGQTPTTSRTPQLGPTRLPSGVRATGAGDRGEARASRSTGRPEITTPAGAGAAAARGEGARGRETSVPDSTTRPSRTTAPTPAPTPRSASSAPSSSAPSSSAPSSSAPSSSAPSSPAPSGTPSPAPSSPPPSSPRSSPPAAPSAPSSYATQLVVGVNAARAEHGKPTLRTSSCAQAAAERWAERLASTGDSGHQDLDRVLDSCDGASRVAENIARTSAGPEKMVATWLDSSGHRRNILGDSTHIGSAAVRGTDGSWTGVQVFLTLRS